MKRIILVAILATVMIIGMVPNNSDAQLIVKLRDIETLIGLFKQAYVDSTGDSLFIKLSDSTSAIIWADILSKPSSFATLVDTGTFDGVSGFGLAQTGVGTELRLRGLIEGTGITIVELGDTALEITSTGGGGGLTYFDEADAGDTSKLFPTSPNTVMELSATNGIVIKGGAGNPTIPDTLDMDSNLIINVQAIDFKLLDGGAPHKEGRITYDSASKTHIIFNEIDGISGNLMREMWTRVKNVSGATLLDGKAVYLSGGTGDLPHAWLAQADDTSTSHVKGLVTHDIPTDSVGYITPVGEVHGLNVNTDDFSHGDNIFLSEDTAGSWVTVQPEICIPIGSVERAHATQGVILVSLNHTLIDTSTVYGLDSYARNRSVDTANQRYDSAMTHMDGMAYNKPTLTVINAHDPVGVVLEMEKEGGGNMTFRLNGVDHTVDCITGAGTGGKARVVLSVGSDANTPQINYIYVKNVGGTATLLSATSLPADSFAWVGKVVIADSTTFNSIGVLLFQRFTEAFINDFRGTASHSREKERLTGAHYFSGVEPFSLSIDVGTAVPDTIHLSTSAGIVYQLHRQTFPSFTTGPYYYGNGVDIYEEIEDLSSALSTQDGSSMSGKRFVLTIWGAVNKTTGDCKLFVNLPNDFYATSSNAIADINHTADFTIPNNFKSVGFLIAKIVLRHQTSSGGTWTELAIFSLLGTPPGTRVGGVSAGVSSEEFDDNLFRIFDGSDPLKIIAFEADAITSGNTRTYIMPDTTGDTVATIGRVKGEISDSLALALLKSGGTVTGDVEGKFFDSDSTVADSGLTTKHYVDSSVANPIISNILIRGDLEITGSFKNWNHKHQIDKDAASAANSDTLTRFPVNNPDWDGSADTLWRDSSCALHPDVVYIPSGWNGYKYWITYTPICISADDENPHIAVSNDGITFHEYIDSSGVITTGDTLHNPLFEPEDFNLSDHISDVDLFFGADGDMYLAFRVTYLSPDSSVIMVCHSTDGLDWSDTTRILSGGSSSLLSPSFILDTNATYSMWLVEDIGAGSENRILKYSAPLPTSGWVLVDTVTVNFPDSATRDIWHINVLVNNADEFVLLMNDTPEDGTGGEGNLYIGTSLNNGLTWDIGSEIILDVPIDTTGTWDADFIYRSAGIWLEQGERQVIELWYSGHGTGPGSSRRWGIGRTTITFAQIDTTGAAISTFVDNAIADHVTEKDPLYVRVAGDTINGPLQIDSNFVINNRALDANNSQLKIVNPILNDTADIWLSGAGKLELDAERITITTSSTYDLNVNDMIGNVNILPDSLIKINDYILWPAGPPGGAGSAGPGDSLILELSSHNGLSYVLYKDSCIAGANTHIDTVRIPYIMPIWANDIDSIIIIMESSNSNDDNAEIDQIDLVAPGLESVVEDSVYYTDDTDRRVITPTRYAYSVANSDIPGGGFFNITIIHKFNGAISNAVVYVYRVFCKVST